MGRLIKLQLAAAGLAALVVPLGALAGPAPAAAEAGEATPAFWLSILHDGAYRVSFDELADVSALAEVPADSLTLTSRGEVVPIWVEEGGDGQFGPGDSFEFLGEHLPGEVSHYNEYSPYNVYRLAFEAPEPLRWTRAQATLAKPNRTAALRALRHFENDRLMVRFRTRRGEPREETWFWERLTFLGGEPFQTEVELDGLTSGEASIRTNLRGWSRARGASKGNLPEHRVDFKVNGVDVGGGEWDGQGVHAVVLEPLPDGVLGPTTTIALQVPKRILPDQEDPLVDLSLLNWIEVRYPHDGTVAGPQTELTLAGTGRRAATLRADGAQRLTVFDSAGRRWVGDSGGGATTAVDIIADEPDLELVAVRDDGFETIAELRLDRPTSWRSPENSADYLMIAHHTLLEGTARLADYHRSRGLEVEVIDVQDLFDEFNHGVVSPRAIRDFVAYAHGRWRAPRPRFVLLVGDASWDIDGRSLVDENYADWSFLEIEATREGFLKNRSTAYDGGPRHRGLLPTGSYASAEGHAASDNYFVAVNDDDYYPALAIGRFPVVDPDDLDAVIDKTIRYIEESGVGPWRRNILWISNEDDYIKKRADQLAAERAGDGFSSLKVYPEPQERNNEQHQQTLIDAFDDGQLVVYFHGHGGRYIWRTGATDYRKNRDLFNLDHLDLLAPNSRLPVVLSMTCYSAPFDHPLADSIGEKFLRLPESGAIAVFAASWRNSPAMDLSRALVRELTKPQTIGEAILKAKRETKRADMVQTYNLLGDPAVPVAAPQDRLDLVVDPTSPGGVRVEAEFPRSDVEFDGTAIVDWLAADGSLVSSEQIEMSGRRLEAVLEGRGDEVDTVSVYMWDTGRGLDAVGAVSWTRPDETVADASPAARSR